MAFSIVQSAEGTSTSATVTAAFSTAPTSGNTIVLAFAADDYNGTPNTGWTQSTGMEQQTEHGGYLWWQISTGSNSFQYTIGSATNSSWVLVEISGASATPYDVSNGQSATGSASAYTTPSITPSSGSRLLIGMFGASNSSGDMSADLTTWTNSFTHIRSSGPASATGTRDGMGVGFREVTGDGSTAFSAGASFPYGVLSKSGLIIAFKAAAAGGSTTPQTVSATSTSAVIIVKRPGKVVSATSSDVTTVTKRAGKGVSALSATATAASKRAGKSISAVSATSALANATRAFLKTVAATVSSSVSAARQAGKVVGASLAGSVAIRKAIAHSVAVLASGIVTVTKRAAKSFTAGCAASASVVKSIGKSLSASLSLAATLDYVVNFVLRVITPSPIDGRRIAFIGHENRRAETTAGPTRTAQASVETRAASVLEENRSASAQPNSRSVTPSTSGRQDTV